MNEQKIIQSFQNYVKGKGFDEKSLSLKLLSEIFIDYYRDVEFNEVNKKADGDMLLFQYGIYDWEGEQYFQINFTRQFYEVYEDGHQIYQLEVTFYYLSDDLSDVLSFNKWSSECFDLDEFQDVIVKSVGFEKAINKISIRKKSELI